MFVVCVFWKIGLLNTFCVKAVHSLVCKDFFTGCVKSFVTSVLTYACWQWYLSMYRSQSCSYWTTQSSLMTAVWLGDRKKQQKQTKKWLSFFFFYWKPKILTNEDRPCFCFSFLFQQTEYFGLFELRVGQKVQGFKDSHLHTSTRVQAWTTEQK